MSIEDKPYGYVRKDGGGFFVYGEHQVQNTFGYELVPIYLRPQREWVSLTDDEIKQWRSRFKFSETLVKEVEAKLRERNT